MAVSDNFCKCGRLFTSMRKTAQQQQLFYKTANLLETDYGKDNVFIVFGGFTNVFTEIFSQDSSKGTFFFQKNEHNFYRQS